MQVDTLLTRNVHADPCGRNIYASPVWNPSTRKQVKMIEDVEKFAIKVVTRRWKAVYQEVVNMVNIPSTESRRLQSSMCTLYKIIYSSICLSCLSWVHFVLAQAICVSCALFCIKYYRKNIEYVVEE